MALRDGSILAVEELSVSYGQIRALQGATLEVRAGEMVALLGANGSGKTTLLETVLGLVSVEQGEVYFKGRRITGRSADRNVRGGICLVPEGRGIFATLSVADNLLLGAHHNLRGSDGRLKKVYDTFPLLAERRGQAAGNLSGGERRMLSLARALMSSPELILVDEPSLGLAPRLVSQVFELLADLNQGGYSILLAEQNAHQALECAHRGYVLETGRVVLGGSARELLRDPGVREAYLGA